MFQNYFLLPCDLAKKNRKTFGNVLFIYILEISQTWKYGAYQSRERHGMESKFSGGNKHKFMNNKRWPHMIFTDGERARFKAPRFNLPSASPADSGSGVSRCWDASRTCWAFGDCLMARKSPAADLRCRRSTAHVTPSSSGTLVARPLSSFEYFRWY